MLVCGHISITLADGMKKMQHYNLGMYHLERHHDLSCG
jgi:hypothetical protein